MDKKPSCSIIIPARNEAENIESCITRLPNFDVPTELIFVEGGSADNTWETILKIQEKYGDQFPIKCFRQDGYGKADAVRMGFSKSVGDIVIILDSDLTVPPEEMLLFYESIANGECEFANGCRLSYKIDPKAMPRINQLANHFFAKLLSLLLNIKINDSLCGTKAIARSNYLKMIEFNYLLGDNDPFGDFELIFGSSKLGLKIKDIPVHYYPRSYGKSNINHLKDGIKLLKVCWHIFLKR